MFRAGDGLVLGIPVESGHRNFGFEFAVSAQDLAVLEGDMYRRKALQLILHEQLQRRLTRGDHAGLDAEVQPIIRAVLHGPAEGLERVVDAAPNAAFIRHHLRAAGI